MDKIKRVDIYEADGVTVIDIVYVNECWYWSSGGLVREIILEPTRTRDA